MTHGKAAIPIDGGFVVKRTPGRVHATFDKAGAEAARLTHESGGIGFSVLKIVGTVVDDSPAARAERKLRGDQTTALAKRMSESEAKLG